MKPRPSLQILPVKDQGPDVFKGAAWLHRRVTKHAESAVCHAACNEAVSSFVNNIYREGLA